jgi:hypothetical protein
MVEYFTTKKYEVVVVSRYCRTDLQSKCKCDKTETSERHTKVVTTNMVVVSLNPCIMSKNLYVPVSIHPASMPLFIMKISPIILKLMNDL